MSRKKYEELRKKRLKEGALARERVRRLRKEAEERREKARREVTMEGAEAEEKRRIEEQLLREKRLEEKRRKKARDALRSVKATVEEVEEKTKASAYVPEITTEISRMLADVDESFRSKEYAKVMKLSYEIKELVEKARLEASRRAEEEKRAEKIKKRRKREAKYFYCVIPCREEKSFGNIGMNKDEVYTVPYRDVAAVVSDSPMKDYELTEDNTRSHHEAARQVMEAYTVVPVEFGTTIKNERILRRLMTKAYGPVKECFKFVGSKVELGVKAVLDKDIVFFDRGKGKECVSDILESLKSKASEFREGDLFSDRLFLNASFLVEKDGIDAFSNEVTRLQEKYPMVKLLYSGPWAPYNFVYIKIGAKGITIAKRE